jgi:dTDP-glucose pyrophosphorylase
MAFCKVEDLFVPPDTTLRGVMECINRTLRGIALVVNADGRLLGTITDGDIRRAMLACPQTERSANEIVSGKAEAVIALVGTDPSDLLSLMARHSVRQLPLLDDTGRLVDLVTKDDILPSATVAMKALIMAGGLGLRLRPLTDDTPKPMLLVGGRPLMERTVERLKMAGVRSVHVATHHKHEKIVEHFGDGDAFGVDLKYLEEERPMGTAGALSLLPHSDEPLLVINGDILTDVDFSAMFAFHREHGAALTVAVRKYDVSVPYGVIEGDGPLVASLVEKPVMSLFVNAGIYLVEPACREFARNVPMDMTELIGGLLEANQKVVKFPVLEYWMDIGQHTDYLQAQEDVKQMRLGA